ncbi:MAG TPA: aminodeoxychorismate/anthranilate synthase component II, partial [Synergistaceae bacterium]|nr:aminodeoxychorismate/anthranilate synthase component II [Synergistaceae bacterium]
MILILDNYDSFTYNLADAFAPFDDVLVVRHDRIDPEGIDRLAPERIVLSPGPGRPEDSGVCPE